MAHRGRRLSLPGGGRPARSALTERRILHGGGGCTLVRDRAAFQAERISPMEPPRGVPVSNPPRLGDCRSGSRPNPLFVPADRRFGPVVVGSGSGSDDRVAELAARAALLGRPEPVQEFLKAPELDTELAELITDIPAQVTPICQKSGQRPYRRPTAVRKPTLHVRSLADEQSSCISVGSQVRSTWRRQT